MDALVFAITPDAAVRQAKVKAGECHLMAYPVPADVESLRQDPKLRVMDLTGMGIGFIAMNTTKKPFDDLRVRRAMNMAIDKEAIVRVVYNGAGTPAGAALPPLMWSHDAAIAGYPHDPEAAKRLLAEAGYPNGFATDLWAMPVQRPYNPNARRMAEMVQADLARIGVTLRIVTYEWGEYLKRVQAGEHSMATLGWLSDNGDPDNFLGLLLGCEAARPGGINLAKWCDREYDGLVTAAKRSTDLAERTALYRRAQALVHERAPWIPVAYPTQHMVMSRKVTGYLSDGSAFHRLSTVGLGD
ncbi:ABC transporter substrate-binding protein [Azospirillum thermophilum]|uniref:ABC transporter substrate-binding protein n=1 Tax=Azospirillum thermophilum TaxID=2202148 RepID=UPI002481DCC9|nr:ABC transporter substrate-binding protein [Azospirillum thermophilum]